MRASCMALILVVAASACAACRSGGPIRIAAVQLGRSLNSDNSVGNHTTQFKPTDTLYVAVLTDAWPSLLDRSGDQPGPAVC